MLVHELSGVGYLVMRSNCENISNDERLCSLDLLCILYLLLYRHVAMDYSKAPLSCESNSHLGLRYRIHRRRNEGKIQLYRLRKSDRKIDFIRLNLASAWK